MPDAKTNGDTPAPLVSVIMPAYNAERFIGEAVDSALAQTHNRLKIIIVDDGSTDNTPAAIGRYAGDPRVRAYHQDNAGPAAARNHGISYARGEYVAFLDADDLWKPDKLEKQLALFRGNPDLGLVYSLREGQILNERGEWVTDKERNRRYARNRAAGQYHKGNCFREMVGQIFIALSSVVVPRRVLDRIGAFDADLITAEDRHLYARIAHHYPIDYVDEPLVIMRKHGANISWDPTREPQTLEFLRKIAGQFPECSLKRKGWMRAAYANCARQSGYEAFDAGRMSQARRELWEACRYRPARLSNWAYLVAAFVPKMLLRALRGLKAWCRGHRAARDGRGARS